MSEENIYTFENEQYRKTYWHTCSHILAQAVKRLWPEVKLAIGPSIDNGFYYDLDAPFAFTPDNLAEIEAEMRKICKEKLKLERFELPRAEAIKFMEEKEEPYKVELINDLPEDAVISFYKQGEFTDLCAGPHVDSTGRIKGNGIKLTACNAAYWRGDSSRQQLQRIYGVAFPNKDELEAYLKEREDALKRDHNKLGRELEYFTTVDCIGQGLPILLPKGARVIQLLQRWVEDTEQERGYRENSAPAADIENLFTALYVFLECLKAETGRLMTASAERESGLKVKHRAPPGVVFVLPCRADEQALAYLYRVKILLPVVLPVSVFALGEVNLVFYPCRREPFCQKGGSLLRVILRVDIYVDNAFRPVFGEQILVNKIDVGYLHRLALEVAVVLDIYAVGHDHVGNVARGVDIFCVNCYLYFCPVHRLSLFYQLRLEIGVVAVVVIELAVVERPLAGSEFAGLNIPARLLDLIYLRVERVERGEYLRLEEHRANCRAELRLAVVRDYHVLDEHERVFADAKLPSASVNRHRSAHEVTDKITVGRVARGNAGLRDVEFLCLCYIVEYNARKE